MRVVIVKKQNRNYIIATTQLIAGLWFQGDNHDWIIHEYLLLSSTSIIQYRKFLKVGYQQAIKIRPEETLANPRHKRSKEENVLLSQLSCSIKLHNNANLEGVQLQLKTPLPSPTISRFQLFKFVFSYVG